eukprot:RCo055169
MFEHQISLLIYYVFGNVYVALPVLAAVLLGAYLGLFREVNVTEEVFPGCTICYKFKRGSYRRDVHPLFQQIAELVADALTSEEAVSYRRPQVGLYYDDPRAVDPQRCRFAVGVVLLPEELDRKVEERLKAHGFHTMVLPEAKGLFTTFPLRKALFQLSLLLAVFRVYAALGRAMEQRHVSGALVVEYYPESMTEVRYHVPVERVPEFSVPEALAMD